MQRDYKNVKNTLSLKRLSLVKKKKKTKRVYKPIYPSKRTEQGRQVNQSTPAILLFKKEIRRKIIELYERKGRGK